MKLQFPKDFLWGAAINSYQVEGGNSNTDWWQWEQAGKTADQSLEACDYYNRFKSDHEFIGELGLNTFRLSIEWGRVQPEEGKFSQDEFAHYREVLQDLKNRNIKTQVTLWWWVSPLWFSQKYGFHNKKSVELFEKYAKKVVDELGDLIDIYQVFNEPMVPLGQGYLTGEFPPGIKNPFKFLSAINNMTSAYKKAYAIVKEKYPDSKVGISYLYNWYESEGLGFLEKSVDRLAKWYRIDLFGNKIKGYQDYFGLDYYRVARMKLDLKNPMYAGFRIEEDKKNIMGWIANPEGMYKVVNEAWKKYHLPIYIVENGTPTHPGVDDQQRIVFLKENLKHLHQAISEGVEVIGYNHWSLMDNFEWLYGFKPRFGLIEIDYATLERKPRKSFYEYAKICKSNEIEIE